MRTLPLSAVLSPTVRVLGGDPSWGSSDLGTASLNCATSQLVASANFLRSSAVHQSRKLPRSSYFDPRASKPWVSSCAAKTPIPPKLNDGTAALAKNGVCKKRGGAGR